MVAVSASFPICLALGMESHVQVSECFLMSPSFSQIFPSSLFPEILFLGGFLPSSTKVGLNVSPLSTLPHILLWSSALLCGLPCVDSAMVLDGETWRGLKPHNMCAYKKHLALHLQSKGSNSTQCLMNGCMDGLSPPYRPFCCWKAAFD